MARFKYKDGALTKTAGNMVSLPFSGATASAAGKFGYVPAPAAGDESKVLMGNGEWVTMSADKISVVDTNGKVGTTGETVTLQALLDVMTA